MYTNTRNAYIEIYFPYMWRIESKHNHYSYCASLLLHQILFIFAVHVVIVVFVSFSAFVRSSVLDVRSLLCCSFFASTLFVVSLSLFLLPSVYAFFLFTRLFGLFFTLNLLYKVVRCIHCARFFLQHFFLFSLFFVCLIIWKHAVFSSQSTFYGSGCICTRTSLFDAFVCV